MLWLKTRHNLEIDPSWIVQLNGVVQGLYAGVRAFSEPGDKILINTPVYVLFTEQLIEPSGSSRKSVDYTIRQLTVLKTKSENNVLLIQFNFLAKINYNIFAITVENDKMH
ncbi:MAG TPA: hypothetical protein GXZ76_05950 [Clostridiaceae bacterium]|nr:hypothetical protein [Clostridiaceae bacterium]